MYDSLSLSLMHFKMSLSRSSFEVGAIATTCIQLQNIISKYRALLSNVHNPTQHTMVLKLAQAGPVMEVKVSPLKLRALITNTY